MPLITLSAIATFTGSTLSSYFTKKGLDVALFSETKFTTELNSVILDTLEEYEKTYPQPTEAKRFPFYHSQKVINEMLKYRVMHEDDYNANDLLAALQSEPNIIPPTTTDIENFYNIFSKKISANEQLKKLEIKQTFDKEIFVISRKLDDMQRNIENILSSFHADLENQWISRLDAYSKTIQQFKPSIALELLNALSKSLDQGSKKPSQETLSLIEYQKGISFSFLGKKDESCKSFISAHKLNPENIIFKEQAAIAYMKIDEQESGRQIANELIQTQEFNSHAWAVLILTTPTGHLQEELSRVPAVVQRDLTFKKLLYNTYNKNHNTAAVRILYDQGLIPDAAEYVDIPVTIDTYSEHVFWLNIAINEYLSNFYMSFTDTYDPEPAAVQRLNHLAGKFLDAVRGTEADKLNEDLHFLYAYTNFLITSDKKYAQEMKVRYVELKNKNSLYTTFCANALQQTGDIHSATEILEEHAKESIEPLTLLGFCYFKEKNFERFSLTSKRLLQATKEVADFTLYNHINLIIQLRTVGKLKEFTVEDFVKEINFESPEAKALVTTVATLLIHGSTEPLITELERLTSVYKENRQIISLISITSHMAGQNENAVELFRTFVDKDAESRDLYNYIYALDATKNDSTELLDLLEKWRLNFSFEPNFLKMELQMRFELLDYETCVKICRYYHEHAAWDESMLVNYAISLFHDNTPESDKELSGLVTQLKGFDYKSLINLSSVAAILIERKYYEEGLELLYRHAKFKENSELRKHYFTACVKASQQGKNAGPLKELEEAVPGSFVKYELDGKIFIIELSEENLRKDFYKAFLGARQGGAITVKRPVTEIKDLIIIRRVMNKYLGLHDEIMEQVHNDPHNDIGMTSFNFTGSDPESLNEMFKKLFGAKGTATKIEVEDQIKRYYNFELSFSEIVHSVFNSNYLGAYFHLSVKEGITSIPLGVLKPERQEDADYILDVSSLAILFQVSREHNITFDKKFVVSKFVVDSIKRQLIEHNSDLHSELSLSITQEAVTPHFTHAEQKESNSSYLNSLLQWIENNCRVEVTTRVIDFTRNIEVTADKKPFIDYLLNTVLLIEDHKTYVLVSDDTQYIRSGLIPISKMVTSEYLIKSILGEEHPALNEFFKNKYLIYTPTLKQLNEEYIKMLASQHNYYDQCLHNINLFRSPGAVLPVILHVREIALNPLLLPDQLKISITSIFVNLLRGVNPSIRNAVEVLIKHKCSLLGAKFNLITNALKDAYSILDN